MSRYRVPGHVSVGPGVRRGQETEPTKQALNSAPIPSSSARGRARAMASIVALIAFPIALASIALLLRSPLARWLVSRPSGQRWSRQTTQTLGGIGIYLRVTLGSLAAVAAGATHLNEDLAGIRAATSRHFLAG